MSPRGLIILIVVWAIALLIVASPAGAMLGLVLGFTVAFFVGPTLVLLKFPEAAFVPLLWTLAALYVLSIVGLAGLGVRAWLTRDLAGARGLWGVAISLAALAWAAKLASASLAAAWP
jgi:hypothetical protein